MAMIEEIGLTKNGPLWALPASVQAQIRAMPDGDRHHAYQKFCQKIYLNEHKGNVARPNNDLNRIGVQSVPGVLTAEACDKLSGQIGTWLDEAGGGAHVHGNDNTFYFKTDTTNRVVPLNPAILKQVMPTVRRVLNRDVVELCEGYLGSHFKLDSLRLFRSLPNDNPLVSFRWHVDSAPNGQLHVFVYLTDSGPGGIGGATEFLSPEGSHKLNELGYRQEKIDNRVLDLAELPGAESLTRDVSRPTPTRGDAIVFPPGVIFHRGVPPQKGWRDALLLVLMPSLDPWQIVLATSGTDHMIQRCYGYLPIYGDPIAP